MGNQVKSLSKEMNLSSILLKIPNEIPRRTDRTEHHGRKTDTSTLLLRINYRLFVWIFRRVEFDATG